MALSHLQLLSVILFSAL